VDGSWIHIHDSDDVIMQSSVHALAARARFVFSTLYAIFLFSARYMLFFIKIGFLELLFFSIENTLNGAQTTQVVHGPRAGPRYFAKPSGWRLIRTLTRMPVADAQLLGGTK
jgi:hypothetical protein